MALGLQATTVLGGGEVMSRRKKPQGEAVPLERPEEVLVDENMDTRRRRPRGQTPSTPTVVY